MTLGTSSAVSQPAPAAATVTDDSTQARTLLMRMADTLAKAKSFSVTIDDGYDVLQESGQKIEFGDVRKVIVSRPSGLRVDLQKRDGDKEQLMFDGTTITQFNAGQNVYARAARPGTVDDVIFYIVQNLQTPIPLSMLLVTTLQQELEKRITDIDLVGHEMLNGKPVDHIAARSEFVDMQAWIASGDPAVPLRIVLTYKTAAGQPQFWANFSDWNFAPTIDASTFAFTPPAGAEAIAFMVPVANRGGTGKKGK